MPRIIENYILWFYRKAITTVKTPKRSMYASDWRPSFNKKSDTKFPLFWLDRDDEELYFINDSDETLNLVKSSTGGFATDDDEMVMMSDDTGYYYMNVLPGEAVKVDHFDVIFDSDFVIQTRIILESSKFRKIELVSPAEKCGVHTVVLLWDNGELGKGVTKNS